MKTFTLRKYKRKSKLKMKMYLDSKLQKTIWKQSPQLIWRLKINSEAILKSLGSKSLLNIETLLNRWLTKNEKRKLITNLIMEPYSAASVSSDFSSLLSSNELMAPLKEDSICPDEKLKYNSLYNDSSIIVEGPDKI